MPSVTNVDLVFCCPSCGADLRASRRDAGSVLDCHLCGEHVRVPHRPHPVEAPETFLGLSSTDSLVAAERGLNFLRVGLFLLLAEYSLLLVAYVFWLQSEGPAAVLRHSYGPLGTLLGGVWLLELALVLARTVCRWWGYSLWEMLAKPLGTLSWVVAARYSTLLRLVGYLLLSWPWLLNWSWPLEGTVAASVKLGQFAWMMGAGLEFAILVPWYRLLQQFQNPQLARRVTVYGAWNVVGLVLGMVGLTLVGLVIIIAVRSQGGMPDRAGQINPFQVPDRGWNAAGGFLAMVGLYWLFLSVLHHRLLNLLGETIRGYRLAVPPSDR